MQLTRPSFLEKAEDRLAGIRGGLLLFAQGRLSQGDLVQADRRLEELAAEARVSGLEAAARLAHDCSRSLELLAASDTADRGALVNHSLDLLSKLEAELLQLPLTSGDFFSDVNDLVETSFEHFKSLSQITVPAAALNDIDEIAHEDFEVDEETLEIFRGEAEGLLSNISSSLRTLGRSPDDTNALWEIRRNAHTFKGAAGIIGFREASELAHCIEDLLDKMVESRCGADGRVIELLMTATDRLEDMAAGKHINEDADVAARLAADFESLIASIPSGSYDPAARVSAPQNNAQTQTVVPAATPTPIVRVSLDRLDDLLDVSYSLQSNRSAIAKQIAELMNAAGNSSEAAPLHDLYELIDTQHRLNEQIQRMLMQIRMVRFGTLEMRLNRAVHVTCQEEGKKAVVVVENPDLEIDTQVIDAMIEPLLHLLKNAVVHGIETTETRRLLGKEEKGRICIAASADGTNVFLSVEDDGRGISGSRLLEKALAAGIVDEKRAGQMDERSVYELIFNRGLTTSDSLNLNAGRGIGMSIVKESVEGRGGSITVETEQQKGTKFTISLPLTLPKLDEAPAEPDEVIETHYEAAEDISPLVLIVDDSPSIRRMTVKNVEIAGFRTITAENGAEALELLLSGEWEPDLIFSDVEMPVMDGWEFLEYVKTDENFGHIPVIMVTSLSSPEYREKAAGLGASDYLVKPFSLQELDRVLEKLGDLASA